MDYDSDADLLNMSVTMKGLVDLGKGR